MRRVAVLGAALALGMLGMSEVPAVAGTHAPSGRPGTPASRSAGLGKPYKLPSSARKAGNLPALSDGQAGAVPGMAQAARTAGATGHSVVDSSLTTATQQVSVSPSGVVDAQSYALPVRVRQGHGWVPVSTNLARAGGRLAARALPGDEVSFSAGGTVPVAEIRSGRSVLKLWWPARLPAPAVSGATATYASILPGVSLVLTATAGVSGGFSEVLVVDSAAAARRVAGLRLRASGLRLRSQAGGGFAAPFPGGSFAAPPSAMWDSSARPAVSAADAQALAAIRAGLPAAASADSPGAWSREARLGTVVTGGGGSLRLVPDAAMLTSARTRYPLYLDPNIYDPQVSASGFDPVQSECTGSHWGDSGDYPTMPVGYDDWGQSNCGHGSLDRALYLINLPTESNGPAKGGSLISQYTTANLLSADVTVKEEYASDCSADPNVTLDWINGISRSTGWPGPTAATGNASQVKQIAANSKSCGGTDTNTPTSVAYNVLPDITHLKGASGSSATNMSFRLWEPNDTNRDDLKQFSDNPVLDIKYIDTPYPPWGLEAATGTNGSGEADCVSDPSDRSKLPSVGKSIGGPYLSAVANDGDGNSSVLTFTYWNQTTGVGGGSLPVVTVADASRSAWQALPSSFVSAATAGNIIGYNVQATVTYPSGPNGIPYRSSPSSPCFFIDYPNDPVAPMVTPSFNPATTEPQAGTTVSFTITQSSGDTATEFVWALDQVPPTGSIPAAQECTATSTTCKLSGGTATVTLSVPSPGPHNFQVYEKDAAGNASGVEDTDFTGSGDNSTSFTFGSSFQANFALALGAGQHFDNTMISTAAGSPGAANADGAGDSLDENQMQQAAGWQPGKTVTVDGATFTLPSFGQSASGPDNLLAANQKIGTGTNPGHASAVVFLATSTDANAEVGDPVTGMTGSGEPLASDDTAPAVQQGTNVTGFGCSALTSTDETLVGGATPNCTPATGVVTYAAGCSLPTTYTLTVPDWVGGPADEAALILPDQDTPAGQKADSPKIYAYAVPVDSACVIASVTLPDVGGSVATPAGAPGPLSALHVFGVALRNTTTATPEAGGTSATSPHGQAWTAAFESPVEDAFSPPGGVTWGNQTFRLAITPDVGEPANTGQVRIRLSDPGFASGDGVAPLQIGAASIAPAFYQAQPGDPPVPLTFGGSGSVTIPKGGDVYSDPVTLPFAITAGSPLLVSLWIQNATLPLVPQNGGPSGAFSYWAPSSPTPNETLDQSGGPFTGAGSGWTGATTVLTGLDVTTSPFVSASNGSAPGAPTVVAAGDNVIDTFGSDAVTDVLNSPSQRLAGQLFSQGLAAGFGPVEAGVESNQVAADAGTLGFGGVSLLARADHDILAEPDVGTVILNEGLEDLLRSSGLTNTQLQDDLQSLAGQMTAFGITPIVPTITPCTRYADGDYGDSCSSAVDSNRTAVNSWLTGGTGLGGPACVADFDAAVSNGANPEALATTPTNFDTGDHANLSFAGYAAEARAVITQPPTSPLAATNCGLYANSWVMPDP